MIDGIAHHGRAGLSRRKQDNLEIGQSDTKEKGPLL